MTGPRPPRVSGMPSHDPYRVAIAPHLWTVFCAGFAVGVVAAAVIIAIVALAARAA